MVLEIVMVHDCAYVGYELGRGLVKRGVIVHHLFFSGPQKFSTLKMAFRLKRKKCDFIHAHFCRSSAFASYASGKPYIISCHGSDIRWGIGWLQKKCLKKAEKVIVSTPDLLEILPEATWLPNPVDTMRFRPLKTHSGNSVLYFRHWYEDLTAVLRDTCSRLDYFLTLPEFYSIPYDDFHLFLNEFDIFVDRLSIKSYSKTALEAMACGIPVIGYEHKLEETLEKLCSEHERRKRIEWQNKHILPFHHLETVVDRLFKIYNECF